MAFAGFPPPPPPPPPIRWDERDNPPSLLRGALERILRKREVR